MESILLNGIGLAKTRLHREIPVIGRHYDWGGGATRSRPFRSPMLTAAIRNRTEYAAALRVGQTALDTKPSGPAARDIVTLTDEIRAIALQEEDRHVQHR